MDGWTTTRARPRMVAAERPVVADGHGRRSRMASREQKVDARADTQAGRLASVALLLGLLEGGRTTEAYGPCEALSCQQGRVMGACGAARRAGRPPRSA